MDSKIILSANLKQYRAKYQLSQEELAARAELSTRGYGKIERAEVYSSLETLDKLSNGTGLSQALLLSEQLEVK